MVPFVFLLSNKLRLMTMCHGSLSVRSLSYEITERWCAIHTFLCPGTEAAMPRV